MSYPVVSVLSALYRKDTYVQTFLDNATEQTYLKNMEFVVDHNEPCNTAIEIIDRFRTNNILNIKHIITPTVVPLGTSWNTCITESNGEYCAIWNFDDLRSPDSIERQVRAFLDDPSLDAVGGDYTVVKTFPSTEGELVLHDHLSEIEFTRDFHLGPFFMFKKSVCEHIGKFDEQFFCANDFDFALRIALNGKVGMVKSNLGYFLNEGQGASTNPNSVCPIEATAIRLRYGIYDQIDYRLLKKALKYNIYNIKSGDEWIPIDSLVKRYSDILEERYNMWYERGIKENFFTFKLDWVQKIKSILRLLLYS